MENQPISNVVWRDREELSPNNYNPNRVASIEMKLLKISIMEDGWTQPIVINPKLEIVDGFHRWTVSGSKELLERFGGKVPTVMTAPKDDESQKMATIRHNRARGTHGVLDMSKIVRSLIEAGLSEQEIMSRLQMDSEEVVRLANRQGIHKSKLIQDEGYSNAWEV